VAAVAGSRRRWHNPPPRAQSGGPTPPGRPTWRRRRSGHSYSAGGTPASGPSPRRPASARRRLPPSSTGRPRPAPRAGQRPPSGPVLVVSAHLSAAGTMNNSSSRLHSPESRRRQGSWARTPRWPWSASSSSSSYYFNCKHHQWDGVMDRLPASHSLAFPSTLKLASSVLGFTKSSADRY
jgi:hypothetical protein